MILALFYITNNQRMCLEIDKIKNQKEIVILILDITLSETNVENC